MAPRRSRDSEETSSERFRRKFDEEVLRPNTPLVAVVTPEEPRATKLIKATVESRAEARRKSGLRPKIESLYRWSSYTGLLKRTNGAVERIKNTFDIIKALDFVNDEVEEGLVIFADTQEELRSGKVARAFRELAWGIVGTDPFNTQSARPIIVALVGPTLPQNESLAKDIRSVTLDLPGEVEMRQMVERKCDEYQDAGVSVDLSPEQRQTMATALLGTTVSESENIVAIAVARNRGLNAGSIQTALDQKAEIIRSIEGVSYEEPESIDAMGGFENLKRYLGEAKASFNQDSIAFGRKFAKGILLVGPPGVGKDHAAKVASALLGLPLMAVDLGEVMAAGKSLLGAAEAVWNRILATTKVLRCIVHLSEYEKVFGSDEGERDGGTMGRIKAKMLTWMNDQEDCMVIASANSLRRVPPEYYRKGRFDSNPILVDLPNVLERGQVLAVHIRKAGRNPANYDLEAVAAKTEWFNCAEIAGLVQDGLTIAWMERRGSPDLTTEDLLTAVARTRPLSKNNEEIAAVRTQAAREEWLLANTPLVEGPSEARREIDVS